MSYVTTLVGYVVGGLIILSLLALVALAGAAVTVTAMTVRSDRADAELRDDLDRVLAEILDSTPRRPNVP